MLNENIRNLRKARGISQEELSIKLHVVRQTVSKWEKGLSVPDSDLLVALSEALDTSVSTLLGETVEKEEAEEGDLKKISDKLENINLQLARKSRVKILMLRCLLISICVMIVMLFIALFAMQGRYMDWDFGNPELAIAGTFLHGFEFLFVRIAPFLLVGSVTGTLLTYRKR